MSRAGALAETILRNPQRLMVSMTEVTARSLRVVRRHGIGLQVGTDNAVSTGPHGPSACGLMRFGIIRTDRTGLLSAAPRSRRDLPCLVRARRHAFQARRRRAALQHPEGRRSHSRDISQFAVGRCQQLSPRVCGTLAIVGPASPRSRDDDV